MSRQALADKKAESTKLVLMCCLKSNKHVAYPTTNTIEVMKHLKNRGILLALLGLASLAHAFGQDSFSKDGFTYMVRKDSCSLSLKSYQPVQDTDYSLPFHIPASVTHNGKTYAVKIIEKWALKGLTDIQSIVIDEGIESVCDYAFEYCTNLRSVSFPASAESIGYGLFGSCYNLTSVVIDAKNGCYDSRDNSNAVIYSEDDELVAACSSTEIPSSVKAIGDWAFYNCNLMEDLVIPEGVTRIGSEVFWGCSSLKSISLPQSLVELGTDVFYGCNSLTSIVIPMNVAKIGSGNLFRACNNLTSVVVDGANQTYDSRYNCNGIIRTADLALISACRTTVICDGVRTLSDYCFYETPVHSLHIPKSVSTISKDAFSDCRDLDSVTVAEGNLTYISPHGSNAILSKDGKTLLLGCRTTVIPYGVEEIGDNAFSGRYSNLVLRLPETVKAIGSYAFGRCYYLTDVIIPQSTTVIGERAFEGCLSLASVQILAPVKIIQQYTFEHCHNLSFLSLAEGTEAIESYAFKGCKSLKHITLPPTVKNVSSHAFNGSPISERQ